MSEVRAENPADGKVANPKVMLNLGSLPPRQKPSAMMREQVSLVFRPPNRDPGWEFDRRTLRPRPGSQSTLSILWQDLI